MKTTMITLAAIFTLLANVLVAGNDNVNTTSAPVTPYTIVPFAPVTPAEATFEDATVNPGIDGLYPAVPSEASFEESATNEDSIACLAPVIPTEADFK
jgi:hypothetical protein